MSGKPADELISLPFQCFHRRLVWAVTGLTLFACQTMLVLISSHFGREQSLSEQPIIPMVIIELTAGAVFLIAVWGAATKQSGSSAALPWIFFIGVFLRAVMFISIPMLEDDYYRYLWDGAVLANGANPFLYSPRQVIGAAEGVPDALVQLAQESGEVISRISFPELKTIYPPVAQAFFAFAYLMQPWSQLCLRIVLALFDGFTLVLLVKILRSLNLPVCLIAIYWWNPLVVRQTFNSLHFDVIVLPFTLAAIILTIKDRHVWAAVALAFAVSTKLWPLVLLPTILWPLLKNPRHFFLSSAAFALTLAMLFLPVLMSGLDGDSGFVAYGKYWEMNDGAYRLISWLVKYCLALLALNIAWTQFLTRLIVAVAVVFWAVWLPRTPPSDARLVWDRCLLIVAAVFLFSPTGFPWYYVWLAPFLAISPRPSLLFLNGILPLYYLAAYCRAWGTPETFDRVILWVEYLPFWGLVLWEWLRSKSRNA